MQCKSVFGVSKSSELTGTSCLCRLIGFRAGSVRSDRIPRTSIWPSIAGSCQVVLRLGNGIHSTGFPECRCLRRPGLFPEGEACSDRHNNVLARPLSDCFCLRCILADVQFCLSVFSVRCKSPGCILVLLSSVSQPDRLYIRPTVGRACRGQFLQSRKCISFLFRNPW